MSLFEKFYPDAYLDSTYVIDFDELYKTGYRGVIFDIDIRLCRTAHLLTSVPESCLHI